MALRNRNINIPEELQTNLKFKSKKRNQKKSDYIPSVLTHAPAKVRPVSLSGPSFNIVSKEGKISEDYAFDVGLTYIDQVFIRCGKLGEGSFGEVYRMKERSTGTYYAIKMLKSNVSEQLFLKEIENNELVGKHKNIVEFMMAWKQLNTMYIQFEYCDMSVADFADANVIPEEILWYLICDMAQALEYLHGKKILHMDIKPSNILISNTTFKLSDFGIIYQYEDSNENSKQPIISDGDPQYLSSEVLDNVYVPESDIFSLGISVIELSCNIYLPSNGILWHQLRHGIMPDELQKTASRALQIIVGDMMQFDYTKRPSAKKLQRYQNVKELISKTSNRPAFLNLDEMNNNVVELDLLQIYYSQLSQRSISGESSQIFSPEASANNNNLPNGRMDTPNCSRRYLLKDPRLRNRCSRNLLDSLREELDPGEPSNQYNEFQMGIGKGSTPNGSPNKQSTPNGLPNKESTSNGSPSKELKSTQNGSLSKESPPNGSPNKKFTANGSLNKGLTPTDSTKKRLFQKIDGDSKSIFHNKNLVPFSSDSINSSEDVREISDNTWMTLSSINSDSDSNKGSDNLIVQNGSNKNPTDSMMVQVGSSNSPDSLIAQLGSLSNKESFVEDNKENNRNNSNIKELEDESMDIPSSELYFADESAIVDSDMESF